MKQIEHHHFFGTTEAGILNCYGNQSSTKIPARITRRAQPIFIGIGLAKDEIKSYQNRLSEVVSANTGLEVLTQVEHFQNQFIRHKEVIDELNAQIHHCEKDIAQMAQSNNVATDQRKADDHTELRDGMDQFKKIFGELRMEYLKFLAKTF